MMVCTDAETLTTDIATRHRNQQQWTPGRLKNRGRAIDPAVLARVDAQLSTKSHPEQAYRICPGLLNLSRAYIPERLEAACRIANNADLIRLKHPILRLLLEADRHREMNRRSLR